MKHLKRFNEAEEYIYGNPAFPEGYLQDALRRRKLQIQEQGEGGDFYSIGKAQRLIAGKENQLEELLTKTMNKIYSGLVERYNITFDIKFANSREISSLLESFTEEKYKRKIANLITQGEAKNMMHVIHSSEITEGVIEIFGEKTGREIIQTWSDIVKAVDVIDMNRDINYFNMSYITNTIMGIAKIDWIPKDEEGEVNEDVDEEDEFYEDPFNEEWENELKDALNKSQEEKVDEIIDKENLPEDIVRKKFNAKIIVRGADFTLLIHESIKGIYNVLSMAGVPKDKEIARRLIGDQEQSLKEEPEEFKWGPIVAADLRDYVNEMPNINKYPNLREEFWIEVLKLPSNEFFTTINGILSKSEEGKIKSNAIFRKAIKEVEKLNNKKAGIELKKLLKIHKERLTPIIETSLKNRVKKLTLIQLLIDKGYDSNLVRTLVNEISSRLGIIEQPTRRARTEEPLESTEVDYKTLSLNQLNDLQNQAIDDNDYQTATKIANEIDRRKK